MCPLPFEIKVWVVPWSGFIDTSRSGACVIVFTVLNVNGRKGNAWMFGICESKMYTMEQKFKNVKKSLLVQINSLNAEHSTTQL